MQRKFKKGIRNLVAERIDGICMEVAANDKKYIRLNGRRRHKRNAPLFCHLSEDKKRCISLMCSPAYHPLIKM